MIAGEMNSPTLRGREILSNTRRETFGERGSMLGLHPITNDGSSNNQKLDTSTTILDKSSNTNKAGLRGIETGPGLIRGGHSWTLHGGPTGEDRQVPFTKPRNTLEVGSNSKMNKSSKTVGTLLPRGGYSWDKFGSKMGGPHNNTEDSQNKRGIEIIGGGSSWDKFKQRNNMDDKNLKDMNKKLTDRQIVISKLPNGGNIWNTMKDNKLPSGGHSWHNLMREKESQRNFGDNADVGIMQGKLPRGGHSWHKFGDERTGRGKNMLESTDSNEELMEGERSKVTKPNDRAVNEEDILNESTIKALGEGSVPTDSNEILKEAEASKINTDIKPKYEAESKEINTIPLNGNETDIESIDSNEVLKERKVIEMNADHKPKHDSIASEELINGTSLETIDGDADDLGEDTNKALMVHPENKTSSVSASKIPDSKVSQKHTRLISS